MKALMDEYRQYAREGRIAYQHCESCGHDQAFIRPFCAKCGETHLAWRMAAGSGKVAALSVVHRAPTADYRDKVPYAIALVDLDEGLRMMAHAPVDLEIGDSVKLKLEPQDGAYLARCQRLSSRA
ncbi:Zn-ribbon domain-containing OB-fold protein [Rhodoligotrophos ferricapiens]|uniref:Zn-ribbon domain-containing OB-fold protein n=1 Tax=Rhodoligotrophos ferricapiens TaxID=3069264 RepID=UPI00315D34CA